MSKKIAVIGECMVELKKENDLYRLGFGGDTLNTAIYLARLMNEKAQISYLTGLGEDEFSREMLSIWETEGIDVGKVHISQEKLPGIYTISTNQNGERSFHYWRNDSAARYWLSEVNIETLIRELLDYELIYLSGISLAILPPEEKEILFNLLLNLKLKGIKIAFDNNYRSILWENVIQAREIYQKILNLTDIAFLTFDDEVILYGDTKVSDCIERTKKFGVNEIVIKRGSESCIVITQDERIELKPKLVEKVIDTTAAGDSFSAGYLSQRLENKSILSAIEEGHLLAGIVIQHKGAIIPKKYMP